ncbi:MAG: hypothetical protein LBH13_00795 [Cellulomonadaceae bacterium]|nr:hypothetical protein [Cellulomonadaceae bacterium]
MITRNGKSWAATHWHTLLDWWLNTYPGPGGTASYWYSLDPVTVQSENALGALGDNAVVSGDIAADLLAPWRRPTRATIYSPQGANLAEHGFTPTSNRSDATLTLISPRDEGLYLPASWRVGNTNLADPIQVLYDIHLHNSGDASDAAKTLVEALMGRHRQRWQQATGNDHD